MRDKRSREQPKPVRRIKCGDCRHFRRDTEGRSLSKEGVFFMGLCSLGLHPDSPVKQFADKMRECEQWERR